jgi:hypothetical protein
MIFLKLSVKGAGGRYADENECDSTMILVGYTYAFAFLRADRANGTKGHSEVADQCPLLR